MIVTIATEDCAVMDTFKKTSIIDLPRLIFSYPMNLESNLNIQGRSCGNFVMLTGVDIANKVMNGDFNKPKKRKRGRPRKDERTKN